MKLELHAKGLTLTDGLRAHVERKLRFALGRFGARVRSVRVQLQDLNGPRGGEDIRCQIQAHLAPTGTLTIQETRRDPFAAVARACDRVSARVTRHIVRRRLQRKGR